MTPPDNSKSTISKVFFGITPEKHAEIVVAAAKSGFDVGADTGQATSHGVVFGWVYDPAKQTLTVTGLDKSHKGWLVPDDWGKILNILAEKIGAATA
jgi:hypothetical protein